MTEQEPRVTEWQSEWERQRERGGNGSDVESLSNEANKQGRELRGRLGWRGEEEKDKEEQLSKRQEQLRKQKWKNKSIRARFWAGHAARSDRAARHGLTVPHARPKNGRCWGLGQQISTVHPCYSARPCRILQFGPSVRSIGPPVQPGTGPRTDFLNFPDRGPDRRGPVRSGLGPKIAQL